MSIFGKPSKRELATEIDRLNAALSKADNNQIKTELRWRNEVERNDVLATSVHTLHERLNQYDEEALAEARRLAVLQHSDSNTGKSYEELVQWLATGTWNSEEGELAEAKVDELNAGYAHGYVKGWNTLLDEIQARLIAEGEEKMAGKFEPLRKTFNHSEAM